MIQDSILPKAVEKKYSKEIAFIRNCAKMNKIIISNHCYEQISNRNIKVKDVYESIKNGVIMEIQNNERDTKILFQDSVNIPPVFFVSVAIKATMGLCVTAYLPDTNKWELVGSSQWRRK